MGLELVRSEGTTYGFDTSISIPECKVSSLYSSEKRLLVSLNNKGVTEHLKKDEGTNCEDASIHVHTFVTAF